MAVVYWIRAPHHTDVCSEGYVGVTVKSAAERFSQHQRDARTGSKLAVHNAIRKYGEAIVLETLLEGDESYCYLIEGRLRPAPNIGYNAAVGGATSPTTGTKHSPEVRAKISAALAGEKHNNFGKKRSEVTKEKISKGNRGAKNGMFGKPLSEEHRLKMSKSLAGLKKPSGFSEKLSKAISGDKNHNFGLVGFLNPKANKVLWLSAVEIHTAYHSVQKCGNTKLSRLLNYEFTPDSLETITNWLKNGWNPLEDDRWLKFSADNSLEVLNG